MVVCRQRRAILRKLVGHLVIENVSIARRPFDRDKVQMPITNFLEFLEVRL